MSFARFGMSVVGFAGVLAAILSAATIWLLFTEPVAVADAVSEQDIAPIAREFANLFYDALRRLLRYL